ncbi:TPA: hypothetical protein NVL56_001941 [Enterobacter hormaechei subsp. xiangfangensis]|uniref:hypothetical protein n=1 Tax=Enterobacter hormaechei TaxID=158836 RepID=UPI002B4BD009|nr:hypothetical protein [Enterobacter hormaechei]WRL99861.1 hypothetical protein RDI40_20015 [Enterobacter hormaechei]HCJ7370011.1 hypothetical protein [Enterobacter hormaechei subsp. xiangfangensis]
MIYMNLINKIFFISSVCYSLSALGSENDEMVLKAYDAIHDNRLTSVKGECLEFDVDDSNDGYILIPVRENHSKPQCGGDTGTSAKLFDLRIRKSDGRIYTNQGSDPDDFRALPSPNSKCSDANKMAVAMQEKTPFDDLVYVIKNAGRTYIYSAPDESCKIKDLFLVQGDLVNANADYNGFSSIIYFKKNGASVSGWIHSDTLTPTKTGIGTKKQ